MNLDGEKGTGSTTWVPKRGRLTSSAAGKGQHPRSGYRWFGRARAPRHDKVTIVIQYKAGSACWFLVEARGAHGMFPGIANLYDIWREVTRNDL